MLELEAYLYGALQPSTAEHDVLAQALNERFVQLGGIYTIPYSDGRALSPVFPASPLAVPPVTQVGSRPVRTATPTVARGVSGS